MLVTTAKRKGCLYISKFHGLTCHPPVDVTISILGRDFYSITNRHFYKIYICKQGIIWVAKNYWAYTLSGVPSYDKTRGLEYWRDRNSLKITAKRITRLELLLG